MNFSISFTCQASPSPQVLPHSLILLQNEHVYCRTIFFETSPNNNLRVRHERLWHENDAIDGNNAGADADAIDGPDSAESGMGDAADAAANDDDDGGSGVVGGDRTRGNVEG